MKQKPFEKNSNSSHYNDWLKEPEMKYITKLTNKVNGKVRYLVSMGKKYCSGTIKHTLREAKMMVDKKLISKGEEPIYILKRKI